MNEPYQIQNEENSVFISFAAKYFENPVNAQQSESLKLNNPSYCSLGQR